MSKSTRLNALCAVVLSVALTAGCADLLSGSGPKPGVTTVTSTPTNSPAVTSSDGAPVALSPGQIVTYSNAGNKATLTGAIRVSGPASLISNNAGGLISNNAGGLISNNAGGYRVAATAATVSIAIPKAVVYLTTPDERFYADDKGKVFYTWTDDQGRYSFDMVPKNRPVIVTVLLNHNRRLVGFLQPREGGNTCDVDVTTTLVTEFMRDQAALSGKTMDQLPGISDLPGSWWPAGSDSLITVLLKLTAPYFENGTLPLKLELDDPTPGFDLTVNAVPDLLNSYITAFSGDQPNAELSEAWLQMTGFRPLLIDEFDVGMPDNVNITALTVGTNGKIYAAGRDTFSIYVTVTDPTSGVSRTVLAAAQGDGVSNINGLTYVAPNELLLGAQGVGQFSINPAVLGDPLDSLFPDPDEVAGGSAPPGASEIVYNGRWQVDGDPWTAADVVAWGQKLIVASDYTHQILAYDLDESGLSVNVQRLVGLDYTGGTRTLFNGESQASGSLLAINAPTNLTIHTEDGVDYLYFSDTLNHRIRRTRLDGVDFPTQTILGRGDTVYGNILHEANDDIALTQPAVIDDPAGMPAENVHLLYPHALAFDQSDNLFFADTNHQRVRVWNRTSHLVKTIAGSHEGARSIIGDSRRCGLGDIYALALDHDCKTLYAADLRLSKKVRRVRLPFGL